MAALRTDSPRGLGKRVAMAIVRHRHSLDCCLAKIHRSRVNGVAKRAGEGVFNECAEPPQYLKNEKANAQVKGRP
jgi:hypothetical protein